jgi:hypothetical protein
MSRATVAVLRTSPGTVLADYHELMNLAGYQRVVDSAAETALKINISWHFFYPAASTTPWQLDGVIRALGSDGYDLSRVHACHNRTVVIDAHLGERENKQLSVVQAHGLRNVHLYEGEEWIDVHEAVGDLTKKFLCLNEVYPQGFSIPRRFLGENIIHLPTVKTHVFTTTTGAMKNAFGGLLNEHRHWTHARIHETLVDLLMIQQKYIRLAHDLGLGCGDPREIEIVGDRSAAEENWHFDGPFKQMTFASRNQHRIYWGPLKRPLEWSLRTWMAPWSYLASVGYHDLYWYPTHARKRMSQAMQSDWGRLFLNWEHAKPDPTGQGYVLDGIVGGSEGAGNTSVPPEIRVPSVRERLRLLVMAVRESPEAQRSKHARSQPED